MAQCVAIEMAELIEAGLSFSHHNPPVRETAGVFLESAGQDYRAGALGLALIGSAGDPSAALHRWSEASNASTAGRFEAAARLLGISVALARLIEANHFNGLPAATIARNLRIGTLCLATAPAQSKRSSRHRRTPAVASRKAIPEARAAAGSSAST